MALSAELIKKVADAIAANQPATRADLLRNYKSEITLRNGYLGYANPRVTAAIDGLSSSEVTYVKAIPLPDEGYVIMLPATPSEPGAIEFTRGDSRRTGALNLRVALSPFSLDLNDHRNLKIPVVPELVPTENGERAVLLLHVKRPSTVKAVRRPRKQNAEAEPAAEPKAASSESDS